MIEYVFFHRQPLELFLRFLTDRGLEPGRQDHEDRFEVLLPEDLDDALADLVDEQYDRMMELEGDLTDQEQADGSGEFEAGGVVVTLNDGTSVYACLDAQLLARVLAVVTPQEFGTIVNAIADAVENRELRSRCQQLRDGDA